jgi:hypothetical protein
MSLKMCNCGSCGVQIGVKSGLSGGGHLVGICLTLLTGLLALPVYVLMIAVSGKTLCGKCGKQAKVI